MVIIDFITKLPKSVEPGTYRLCNIVIVMVCKLTKATKFVLMTETITAEGLTYKVFKNLIAKHGLPD
jgi:hypothetical protein